MPSQIVSPKVYVRVFAALMALLALTVAVSFVNLGPFNTAASLAISISKAALIGLFFMEVRDSKPIIWLFAGAAFAWLLILLVLTMSDYSSRAWSKQDWKNGTGRSNHLEFTPPR
jgi:cytochrome c oxidase subunit 4